jgi:thiamine-monophosphate kinase
MPGEFDFISWIRSQQRESEMVRLSAGDDLAILKWKAEDLLLVGVDQVLDGVHFDSTIHSPRAIGRKAMNRNLSDCAAMACLPAAAVATAALPRGTSLDYSREFYLGMKEAADAFDCAIVGGDTASWEGKLVVTVTILGRSAGNKPLTRKGARPGDSIYVTGNGLGGSILGRHMSFMPRVAEGFQIGGTGLANAMIDLSDGLSRDLAHVCRESGVGAVIDAARIPIHRDAIEMPPDGRSPLEHALHDGEDYELLFTGSPQAFGEFTSIGRIVAEPGIFLETSGVPTTLEPKGWEHKL